MDKPMHFDLPFRFGGSPAAPTAVMVEQDSLEDVSNCVEAIMRTHPGQRLEVSDFGIPDLAFSQAPIAESDIIAKVLEFEPRATLVIDQVLDLYDSTHTQLDVNVSKSGGAFT